MKKTILVALVAMFAITFNSNAQGRGPGNGDRPAFSPEKRAEAMAKQLDLTADQKDALVKHFEATAKEMEKNREKFQQESKENREDRRAEMNKVREQNDKELEKIIGKDKLAKWKEIQKERFERRRGEGQNRPERQGPPSPNMD